MRITLDYSQSRVKSSLGIYLNGETRSKAVECCKQKRKGPFPLAERNARLRTTEIVKQTIREIYNGKFRFICFIPLISSRRVITFLSDSQRKNSVNRRNLKDELSAYFLTKSTTQFHVKGIWLWDERTVGSGRSMLSPRTIIE